MAKKFFYVCAGLFLLTGAYVLGARRAVATGAFEFACVAMDGGTGSSSVSASAVIGRTLYTRNHQHPYPIPGTSPVIACSSGGCCAIGVMLANGDVYEADVVTGEWLYSTNVVGKPTPIREESWSQLKSRYR